MANNLRFLVIDGYNKEAREELVAGGASLAADQYTRMLEGSTPGGAADIDQAVGVRRVGSTDDEDRVDLGDHALDRVLAVLRRVADVVLARQHDLGEALLQRVHDLAGVVDGDAEHDDALGSALLVQTLEGR